MDAVVKLIDRENGQESIHIPAANGPYETVCGLDGEEFFAPVVWRGRVDCENCIAIWRMCKRYKKTQIEGGR